MPEAEAEKPKLVELTDEQWAAGREIAEYCGFSEDILESKMLWNDDFATVAYGLAHSARYMDALTVDEIKTAVSNGIRAYEASVGNPDGNQ